METKRKLSGGEKFAYGIGAVGKDMVYMLSASWVLYYYQNLIGINSYIVGAVLLAARVFDAFNDPIMGVVVAKTKTKWGKFRPWLLIGTLLNAIMLIMMFSAPPTLKGAGLVTYFAASYILWGVTYTMMDIPYWSMIPAFTESGKEREGLSALARSCAGVGSALISIITVMSVAALGRLAGGEGKTQIEILGFRTFAILVGILFVVFTTITCMVIKEKSSVDMKTASVGEMFSALIHNDQAMVIVFAIVLINTALYITSNLVIYFFKYVFLPSSSDANYTLFNTFGGAFQILAMMILFPVLRKFMNTIKIFYVAFCMAFCGYVVLILEAVSGMKNVYLLLVPAFLIMGAIGVLNVVITIFLANTVDYGEYKNGRRDESVIFSMQTFVVKLASGISALIASIAIGVFQLDDTTNALIEQKLTDLAASFDLTGKDALTELAKQHAAEYNAAVWETVGAGERMGLQLCMTIIPILVLVIAFVIFKKKYILTDQKLEEITNKLNTK